MIWEGALSPREDDVRKTQRGGQILLNDYSKERLKCVIALYNKEASCYCGKKQVLWNFGDKRKISVAWEMTTSETSSIVFSGDEDPGLVQDPSSGLRSEWGMTIWKEWAYKTKRKPAYLDSERRNRRTENVFFAFKYKRDLNAFLGQGTRARRRKMFV